MVYSRYQSRRQEGFALLGTMVIVLILSLLGATLLNLAGQEVVGAAAEKDARAAQQLADGAGELVTAWFHGSPTLPSSAAAILAKRNNDGGGVSFFDQAGRSQFVGTIDRPDLVLTAATLSNDNHPQPGLFDGMKELGRIEELKIYAPTRPGLLCTVDVTVSSKSSHQSIVMQLAALEVPPLRAAVQVGRHLGVLETGTGSPVHVHWGDLRVGGDFVLHRLADMPAKSMLAPITGKAYGETLEREDRWMEAWVGSHVHTLEPTPGPLALPPHLHAHQIPAPGLKMDAWSYDHLKRIAKQHGTYFAIDQEGLLYPQGRVEPGHGLSPDAALQSHTVGEQRGLIFIDTLDQTAPRSDNLGTVTIRAPYLEGLVAMQGHLVLSAASGQPLSVLSPPLVDPTGVATRHPVQLSHIQVNGALYAAGNITVSGGVRVFGAVTAEGTIVSAGSGGTLEVWYNHDMSRGLYKGLPVVYRAPGTWMARY